MRCLRISLPLGLLILTALSAHWRAVFAAEPPAEPGQQQSPSALHRGPSLMAPAIVESSEESAAKADANADPPPRSPAAEKTDEDPAGDSPEKPEPAPAEAPAAEAGSDAKATEPQPLPELSKEMAAFRDRIRRTLGRYYQQPVSSDANTADDILHFCLAFGCEAEIRHGNGKINGIGCLCWNYACGGYRLLLAGNEGIVARIGYGFQSRPSQLLAVLAQTAVPESYELRVGDRRGTVADLVEHEKRTCRQGEDQAMKLVGLAVYVRDGAPWKNEAGEEWSLEKLLKAELDRQVPLDDRAATDRLLALSYAMERQTRSSGPQADEYEKAQQLVADFQRQALSAQNSDGSWHPKFFAAKGTSRDTMGTLRSTGHILHWLAYSLPDSQLQTAEMLRGVHYVNTSLESLLSRWSFASASPQDMSTVAYAIRALMTYDRRVFRPHDAKQPPASAAPPANKQAHSAAPAPESQARSAARPQSTRRAPSRRR